MVRVRNGARVPTVVAALAAAVALACASVQVDVEFDPDEDFSALRTFAWYPRPTAAAGSRFPDLWSVVKPSVEKALGKKGYTRVPAGQADFFVHYHLSIERRLDTVTINAVYRQGGSEWEVHRTQREEVTVEYNAGILVIDVLDVRTRRLVWRGTGTRRLHRNPQAQQVEQAVAEVLSGFPPGR